MGIDASLQGLSRARRLPSRAALGRSFLLSRVDRCGATVGDRRASQVHLVQKGLEDLRENESL